MEVVKAFEIRLFSRWLSFGTSHFVGWLYPIGNTVFRCNVIKKKLYSDLISINYIICYKINKMLFLVLIFGIVKFMIEERVTFNVTKKKYKVFEVNPSHLLTSIIFDMINLNY